MYSKEQASQLRQAFWTAFGQYMTPVLSADGEKISWVNYKTGIKHLYFRMQAENGSVRIAIEIAHPDPDIQELFFQQFLELKNVLNGYLAEDWGWHLHATDEYRKTISSISRSIDSVNVFDNSKWPEIISFLKPRIIALDEFWSVAKYSFDDLK